MFPQTFIFIGRSGCGKGTQAKLLEVFLRVQNPPRDIIHLETGKLFREFIKGETYTHRKSKKIYVEGGLQPEFLTIDLWATFFINSMKENAHIIIDGTPRKYHEAQVLDSAFKFYNRQKPYLIFINVSREWANERLEARGRIDDNSRDIKARLDWFESDVVGAINFYKNNQEYHFLDINGERPVETVHANIIAAYHARAKNHSS